MPYEKFRNKFREKRNYVILTWDVSELHNKTLNPLKNCSVKNCIFTTDKEHLITADLVVIPATVPKQSYPKLKRRKKGQKWVVYTNGYIFIQRKLKYLENVVNWTMTYRIEADIPVPYGRTVSLPKPLMTKKEVERAPLAKIIPNWAVKTDDVLATTVQIHDTPTGKKYLKELLKYMKVDVCSGLKVNCNRTAKYYMFYLAFQNLKCNQYITEDIFDNSYYKGAIPVILGTSLENCELLLPPQSFIHVDQFASVKELAMYMNNISSNTLVLRGYHRWRNHFAVVNEYGLTCHFCRLCEALNYNDDELSIYNENDLKYFFDKNKNFKYDWRQRTNKKRKHKKQNVTININQHLVNENKRVKSKFKKKQTNRGKKKFNKRI